MTEDGNIDRIIFFYLSDQADCEEIQILRNWLNEKPEHKEIFEKISAYWKNSKLHVETEDNDNAYNALLSRIRKKDEKKKTISLSLTMKPQAK